MGFVDTHSHLYFEDFNVDRQQVVDEAKKAKVDTLLHVGTTPLDSLKCLELAELYGGYVACGLHPHHAKDASQDTFHDLKKLAQHPKVVAIGEIGLDFFRNESPQRTQIEVFKKMIRMAQELNLPIIVHSRDSHEEVIETILEAQKKKPLRGVMHCFSGDRKVMRQALDLGFLISFAAPVTYKKNDELRACAQEVPEESFVLETDCPFLPPQSKRGKRNEPAFLIETAQTVCQTRRVSLEQLAAITTRNAQRLFNIGLS
jgi:TatD DNase family protein